VKGAIVAAPGGAPSPFRMDAAERTSKEDRRTTNVRLAGCPTISANGSPRRSSLQTTQPSPTFAAMIARERAVVSRTSGS